MRPQVFSQPLMLDELGLPVQGFERDALRYPDADRFQLSIVNTAIDRAPAFLEQKRGVFDRY